MNSSASKKQGSAQIRTASVRPHQLSKDPSVACGQCFWCRGNCGCSCVPVRGRRTIEFSARIITAACLPRGLRRRSDAYLAPIPLAWSTFHSLRSSACSLGATPAGHSHRADRSLTSIRSEFPAAQVASPRRRWIEVHAALRFVADVFNFVIGAYIKE